MKKDQLVAAMSAAGATKEEISVFLDRLDQRSAWQPTTEGAGGMTDASKRRQVADDDGFSLVDGSPTKMAAGEKGYERSGVAGTGSFPLPTYSYGPIGAMAVPFMADRPSQVGNVWEGDEKIPLPVGIETLEQWGNVINTELEGHRDITIKGLSFGEILSDSHKDPKVRKYLQFLCRKFKPDIKAPFAPKTQGPDLAAFAMRCFFDPEFDKDSGYVRKFKK